MIRVTGYKNIGKLGKFIYATYHSDKIGLPRKFQKYSEIIDRNKCV
jgi:hypothetical protein